MASMPAGVRDRHLWLVGAAVILGGALAAASGSPRVVHAFAALLLLAAIAYIGWHIEPAYMLCGALAASVFAGNWRYLGLPSLVAPDRLVLVGALASIVLHGAGRDPRARFRLTVPHLLLVLVTLYCICSMVWVGTIHNSGAVFRLIDRFGVTAFVVYAIAPLAFTERRHFNALLWTMVALGAYLGLTALFETLGAHALVQPSYINDVSIGSHAGRARGPFLEAEAAGIALFACALACFVALRWWTERWSRAFAATVAALCLAGTLFTLTRAVWIGVIVAGIVAFLSTAGLRRFLVPAAVGTVLVVVALLAFVPGLDAKVNDRSESRASVYDRQNLNAAAIRVINAKPAFGVGWQRWQAEAEPYYRAAPDYPLTGTVGGTVQVVHNVFLGNFAELGLIGGALWLAAFAAAFGRALLRPRARALIPWRTAFLALVVMWTVVALLTPQEKPFTTIIVFLWAGILGERTWAERAEGIA